MKKFIAILVSCSLGLAAGAMAQQDEAQPTPTKKKQKKAPAAMNAQPAQPQPAQPHAAQPHAAQPHSAQPHAAQPPPRPQAPKKVKKPVDAAPDANAQAPANEPVNTAPNANPQAGHQKKGKGQNAPKAPATANEPVNAAPEANAHSQAPAATEANKPNQARKLNAQAKKPDTQAIKAKHANFHAQPKPQQVPPVTFNQSRQITGSEHWQGEKYAAFRSYHPQMHDHNWYHAHYNRIVLIGGGYYFWNLGYWYPAWGYNPSQSYYVYDGPIYAGTSAEPPDRVIANVQASLQEMGYYTGEVDGLLGPLTREALTAYQIDNGLYTTAAIDEPTLGSLGML